MTKLILATNNKNKLREIHEMLAGTGIHALSLGEAGISAEIEETGTTFEENAAIKAKAIYDIMLERGERCYVLADDSGLSVDALDGAPGVYSARWAGEGASDADLIAKLLDAMKDVPDGQRGAHFACVMCLIKPDGTQHFFTGKVGGTILRKARGKNGFGYDPVFAYQGCSFAEIPAARKNAVSHRHHALMQVEEFFTGDHGESREKTKP
ncbi:MAG: RdgB/HAM1 family non-canonical purine NTP pyrophosphatase [Oscillospiraceae bacterium]|nr:RdgB/HAM1 family non-canonical purine NTP pyrophosphatase [Oscillospiraceae bacterium]